MAGPFIVLEGPDGSGKTTLANALVTRGLAYGHCGAPTEPAREYFTRELRRHVGPAVLDRLHVGSYVYGHVFRGRDDMTDFDHWLFNGELLAANALLVHCTPPAEASLRVLETRPPNDADALIYEDVAKQAAVRQRYHEYITGPANVVPTISYDFTKPDDLAATVRACMAWVLAARSSFVRERVPVLGNTSAPTVLLVGDQPASRPRAQAHARVHTYSPAQAQQFCERLARRAWPTRALFNSTSGLYLYGAMTAVGLSLRSTCIVNSVELDGRRLDELVDVERARVVPRVVALGRNAATELRRVGVTHEVAPHPQHWRRFHYKDVWTYGRMLLGELTWTGCATDSPCRGRVA